MFGTFLIVACTVMQLYVFWRASSVPAITRRVPRGWLAAIAFVLWAGLVAARTLLHGDGGSASAALQLAGMDWMATLFLLCVALLAVELPTGFGLLAPRLAPRLRGWALAAGGVMAAIAIVQGIRAPVVRRSEVVVRDLPAGLDGTVLVAVSDLHVGALLGASWLAARVDEITAQKPDIVVLLGDIVESRGGRAAAVRPVLARLAAPLGVWAVTGNHEFYGRGGAGPGALEEAGLAVLHDRWVEVRPGLTIAGVDDLTSRRRAGEGAEVIRRTLARRPAGAVILLSHTPWYADAAASAGASLMLCGHTHGGQVWPFGALVRTVYPLLAGRYEVGGMPVIVTIGAGTWGPRMRLWAPGEILRITLRSGQAPVARAPG